MKHGSLYWLAYVLLATVFGGQHPVSSAELGDAPSTIPPAAATGRHAVPRQHPRLLGSRERLKRLARERPEAYQRVVRVAREQDADEHAKMVSLALVTAVEGDEALGKRAVDMAMKMVNGPIKRGHVPFGSDLARCAIVYVRPDTFILFDRVISRRPEFKKSWLLQAISRPEGTAPNLVITNGKGRLFVQTLLPRDPEVRFAEGPELYAYDGKTYPTGRDTGAAPACRIMISPSKPALADYFLHVLTAKDSSSNDSVPKAVARETASELRINAGGTIVAFQKHNAGGYVEFSGQRHRLPEGIVLRAHARSKDN